MAQVPAILFGAAFTVAVCWALGGLLLRPIRAATVREREEFRTGSIISRKDAKSAKKTKRLFFASLRAKLFSSQVLRGRECSTADPEIQFVVGAALLSGVVFACCAVGVAYPAVFLGIGAAALGVAWRSGTLRRPASLEWPRGWAARLLLLGFAVYAVALLAHAMAPEASPDGATYHLGLVSRYLREHRFVRITDNFYASMPAGVEMLFLFAFAFGAHSAAALVHFAFLLALVWQMWSYGRNTTAFAAALLIFASPLVGIDGTSAYNDVALAAIAFTVFRLLQIWGERRDSRVLVAIGLVAGFAFATKYTAWLGAVYAVGYVAWRSRRAALVAAVCASAIAAPWLVKNWIYFGNPVAPFFNRVFPNPYVTTSFEDTYRGLLATYRLTSRWQIPMEVTTHGSLGGLVGPVFLLAPLGLLALTHREGRSLWLAALAFGANYFGNVGARFLIPTLPFVALAMTMPLRAAPNLAVALALVHCVLSWPSMIPKYSRADAWRLDKVPWREALRIKPAEGYLESHLPGYGIDRLIEQRTRPGSTVFTFTPIPEAYTSRRIRVEYQSAENKISGAILWTAVEPSYLPTWRLRFGFARQHLRGLRLVQTGTGPELWNIHELRIYEGERELARAPRWRLTARPYPWGIADAFDNSPVTFWLSGESLRPGQTVDVDFGGDESADAVVVESAPNQTRARFRLEGRDGAGQWRVLSPAPVVSDAPRPLGLRRAAAEEMKHRGIDYVLLFDDQVGADDLRSKGDLWGVRAVGDYKGARLYELP